MLGIAALVLLGTAKPLEYYSGLPCEVCSLVRSEVRRVPNRLQEESEGIRKQPGETATE